MLTARPPSPTRPHPYEEEYDPIKADATKLREKLLSLKGTIGEGDMNEIELYIGKLMTTLK